MTTNQTNEFAVWMSSTFTDANTPAICPCCARPATQETKILAYNFQSSTGEIIIFGLLGQLFSFVAFGSDSKSLLTLRVCERCNRSVVLYKTLEWVARLGGILLTVFFLVSQSSEEEPLITRGAGPIILTLMPLVLGAILSYIFRSRYDESKGVVFVKSEGGKNWFRVQSADWLREFSALSSVNEVQKMEMDETYRNKVRKFHDLIHEQIRIMIGGKMTTEIQELLNDLVQNKEQGELLLSYYSALYKANLIGDLIKINSSYDAIRQNVSFFIDLDIVNETFPHDRK